MLCSTLRKGAEQRTRIGRAPPRQEFSEGRRDQQKRSDTLNKNLSKSIPQFSDNTTLGEMRQVTGEVSEEGVRRAAAKLKK
jgi:hypothetical protein